MVAEAWISKMGNQVSSNLKNALNLDNSSKSLNKKQGSQEKEIIGILSFEVANVMSKIINLHKSLTDHEVFILKNEILKSDGIKTLISNDETHLLELALFEKLDDLNRIAGVVSRLGKKCTIPALQGFEHVYGDIISGVIEVHELSFLVKDMEAMMRKMERYVNSTVTLYSEMEVMNELELATKKFQQNHLEESRKAFEQKLTWQRQDVKHLKEVSLWNQTYDKIVELLARTTCTVYARLHAVFGDSRSQISSSGSMRTLKQEQVQKPYHLDVINKAHKETSSRKPFPTKSISNRAYQDFNFVCGRLFMECLSLSTSANDNVSIHDDQSSQISVTKSDKTNKKTSFSHAPPTTIGGSALTLHYANVIIIIEKLLCYPHLVGDEARDDLYQMLPKSLKKSLKTSLQSHSKNMGVYDTALANHWRERVAEMLTWLGPLAHNTVRWQSERNFEQKQQIVRRSNVLLLQTLYYGDRAKVEEVMTEVLVALNYICGYEQQQNALLGSFDFQEWQLQQPEHAFLSC